MPVMKRYILLTFILLAFIGVSAQSISVKSFQSLPMDMTASSLEGKRVDQNGDVAALIKVVTTQTGFTFEGGTLGIVDTKQRNGEIWVWVPRASRKITILHQQLGVLRDYRYPIEIEAERTYEMVLSTGKAITTIEEEISEQYLIFQLNPKDAALEVNDQLWTVSTEGIARKYVKFGTYTYRVQAPNYYPEAGNVTVDDPNNKKTVPISLRPNFGWVEVKGGNVKDAAVYIDNAYVGKAPCKSDILKSGEHIVKIVKEMYMPYTERVSVSDNETTSLLPLLTADFSSITLVVDADAEIWVNEEKKGIRSWTGNLASGSYRIECRLANHEPTAITKEITNTMEGETIILSAPKPIYGSLNVESIPDFANIYIDGKAMGETPSSISQLLIGQHELRLTKDGYADYKGIITITKGERKQIQAELQKQGVQTATISNDEMRGLFSVGYGKHVCFSQGNLQYNAFTNTWRFAENQWDMIGDGNSKISSSYSGWIDLFGWGTGNNPTNCAQNENEYGLFNEWGDNMNIRGKDTNNQWRTLTTDEWSYVFSKRQTSSGYRYAKAQVNDVNGIILLPDTWKKTLYSFKNANQSEAPFDSNIISLKLWEQKFVVNGAVFLPCAGSRGGTNMFDFGNWGNYWSSSGKRNGAWYLYFSNSSLFLHEISYCSYGRSVRLVQDYQP